MSLSKFLNPQNDVAFRHVFGNEKNKDILIHFLNDMLTFKQKKPIVDVTFLKTIQDPETAARKTSIVDVLCKDDQGHSYVVEMQVAKEKGFEKRAQYYAAKAYTSQMNIGGKYEDLTEVIFLAISNFIMFPNKQEYKSDHVILDKKSYENDLKGFSFTFIELPKFNKDINQIHQSNNIIEKWCYFFKHAAETHEDAVKQLATNDQIIERAYTELNRFSWSDDEIRTYDQIEKYEWAYNASMDYKFDQGFAEGEARGEKKASLLIAKNLLNSGIDVAKIAELTLLSGDEIEDLKNLN